MYHIANDFAKDISETILEMEGPDFYMHSFSSPGPDDEDEEESDDDESSENSGADDESSENSGADDESSENSGAGAGNDDPPIDKDVVHSPVPPKTGGRPK